MTSLKMVLRYADLFCALHFYIVCVYCRPANSASLWTFLRVLPDWQGWLLSLWFDFFMLLSFDCCFCYLYQWLGLILGVNM